MINLLDKDKFDKQAQELGTDHYCKKFDTFQHLITMIYGVTSGCNSLRELTSGIVSYGDKITHCKFNYSPRRSTVSDANKRRDYGVFEAIYDDLVKQYPPDLSDSQKQIVIDKKAYAIDSTTISIFYFLLPSEFSKMTRWVGNHPLAPSQFTLSKISLVNVK